MNYELIRKWSLLRIVGVGLVLFSSANASSAANSKETGAAKKSVKTQVSAVDQNPSVSMLQEHFPRICQKCNTFRHLLQLADFEQVLAKNKKFTLLVVDDEAFAKMPKNFVEGILSKGAARQILNAHLVLEGVHQMSSDQPMRKMMKTLGGEEVSVFVASDRVQFDDLVATELQALDQDRVFYKVSTLRGIPIPK